MIFYKIISNENKIVDIVSDYVDTEKYPNCDVEVTFIEEMSSKEKDILIDNLASNIDDFKSKIKEIEDEISYLKKKID